MYKPYCILISVALSVVGSDVHGAPTWKSVGPEGGLPRDIVFAADGDLVWLTTESTFANPLLYLSRNRGATFRRVSTSAACSEDFSIESLAPDRENPRAAWLACGPSLARTTDAGTSWEVVYTHPDAGYSVWSVKVDPQGDVYFAAAYTLYRLDAGTRAAEPILQDLQVREDTLQIGADGSLWARTFAAPYGALQRSRDGGQTWQARTLANDLVWWATDPREPERIWAWSSPYYEPNGFPLQRSDDGGASFSNVGPSFTQLARVTFGDGAPQVLYAAGRRRERSPFLLRRSDDGGAHWRPVAGLPHGTFSGVVANPEDPEVLLAVSASFETLGLPRSMDGGATWRRVGRGLTAVPIQDVAIEANARGRLWAVVDFSYLYREQSLWRRATGDPIASVAADPKRAGRLWVTTRSGGVRRTDDGGKTWEPIESDHLGSLQIETHPLPQGSGVLFAVPEGVFTYPCGRLSRSGDGGEHWDETGTHLDEIWRISGSRKNPDRLGLTGEVCSCSRSCDGDLVAIESADGGRSWSSVDLPGIELAFAWSPRRADVALVATSEGLFRRRGADGSWNQVDADRTYLDLAAGRKALYALRGTDSVSAWISTDDGRTWQRFGPDFADADLPYRLEVLPGDPDRVVARSRTCLFELGEP